MNLEKHKDFFDSVFQVVRLIPEGRVTSYGEIAKYLGSAKSSRMVGWAMNASHTQTEYVPAHRVVNRNGMLTGKMHFPSPKEMEQKLTSEGAIIQNDKIVNFKEMFWSPLKELEF